ncbi:MAG: hypothetical protein K2I01_06955 [Lachnospiraceae bacterium]|nr:hypothetical protein [Lachnospiraceae bacterium]
MEYRLALKEELERGNLPALRIYGISFFGSGRGRVGAIFGENIGIEMFLSGEKYRWREGGDFMVNR